MESETKKLIQNQFKSLPKGIRDYVVSEKFNQMMQDIGRRHQYNEQEAIALENETVLVFMGLESIEDYAENLQRVLKKPAEEIEEVAIEIAKEVFSPMKQELRMYLQQAASSEEKAADTPETKNDRPEIIRQPPNISKERFEKRFEALPEELRQLFSSGAIEQEVRNIGSTFSLSAQQLGALEEQVRLRILGFIRKANFLTTLKEQTDIEEGKIQKIGDALEQGIFLTTKQALINSNARQVQTTDNHPPTQAPPKTRHYATDPYHEPIG